MKSFSSLPTRTVVLRRETGTADEEGKPVLVELSIDLRPWPIGFPEMLGRVFPAPVRYENGKPVPDPSRAEEHQSLRLVVLLATCMGAEIATKAPGKDAQPSDWTKYANDIRAEFEAANLVEGDVSLLLAEAYKLNQGQSRPKA